MKGSNPNNYDRNVLYENDFSANKNDFVNHSFTLTKEGLQSPSAFDLAFWNENSANEKVVLRARVKINDNESRFALIRKTTFGIGGTVGEIDCAHKKLNLYVNWDGNSRPTNVYTSVNFIFNNIAEKEYLVELEKNVALTKFRMTDVLDMQTSEITFDQEQKPRSQGVGMNWGNPGLMFFSGDITIKKLSYVSKITRRPKLLVIGDSFVEQWYMRPDSRYSALLRNELDDVVIAGRGGDKASKFLERMHADLELYLPQYTILQFGTNDSGSCTLDEFLKNLKIIIDTVESKNSVPILVTLPPKPNAIDNEFIFTLNDWIRTSRYKYIDFNKVLTLNNDGQNWDPAFDHGDHVHPNVNGNKIMFKKIKIDIPELFD